MSLDKVVEVIILLSCGAEYGGLRQGLRFANLPRDIHHLPPLLDPDALYQLRSAQVSSASS